MDDELIDLTSHEEPNALIMAAILEACAELKRIATALEKSNHFQGIE